MHRRTLAPVLAAALVVAGSGCTRSLMIQPDENPALSAVKIAARIPFAIVSLGTSEAMAGCVRRTAAKHGWDTLPESPAWDVCNNRSDFRRYDAMAAGVGQGVAQSQREQAARQATCDTTCQRIGDQLYCTEHCH